MFVDVCELLVETHKGANRMAKKDLVRGEEIVLPLDFTGLGLEAVESLGKIDHPDIDSQMQAFYPTRGPPSAFW